MERIKKATATTAATLINHLATATTATATANERTIANQLTARTAPVATPTATTATTTRARANERATTATTATATANYRINNSNSDSQQQQQQQPRSFIRSILWIKFQLKLILLINRMEPPSPSVAMARAFIRTAPPDEVRRVRSLVDELEGVCLKLSPTVLSNLIDYIMMQPKAFRDAASRNGAIRCRRACDGSYVDEACWIDPDTAERYFHPSRRTYAKAIHYHCIYAPPGAQILWANWTDTTVASIVDYVFGSAYRDPSDEKWRFFRDHLEQVCHKVIALNKCFDGPRNSRLWAHTIDTLNVFFSSHPDSLVGKELARIFPSSSLGVETA